MPRFRYRALAADGRTIKAETVAEDHAAAVARVQDGGCFPIEVERADAPAALPSAGPALPLRGLAQTVRELAVLLEAGVPLDDALRFVDALLPAGGPLRPWLRHVAGRVRGGAGLADAMAEGVRLPSYVPGMVRAGEEGGALAPALHRLADLMARRLATRDAVVSALVYPAVLTGVAALSILVILLFVVPQFAPLFAQAGDALPASARILLAASAGLREGWPWLLAAALLLPTALVRAARSPAARRAGDRAALRLPVLRGFVRDAETARFAHTLGTLLGAGVALPSALSVAGGSLTNRAFTAAADAVAVEVRRGAGLAAPLAAAGLFPPVAVQLVRVGEESGQLAAMLQQVADLHERILQRNVARALALLVPALTVALGGAVAGIVATVLSAILSVNNLIA